MTVKKSTRKVFVPRPHGNKSLFEILRTEGKVDYNHWKPLGWNKKEK